MVKLLLIEDEKILRENTCELLEVYGFNCLTAKQGREGLDMALTEKPDLIICDIMLPYLNGYQIKAKLNELYELAQIPFIFLSAKVERTDLRQGMELGADDYITKPFKIIELVNSIKSRLVQSKNIQSVVESKVIESLNDFIHVAKHECNTPLNGIINLSGLLMGNYSAQPAFLDAAVKAINTSGKRLYKTLNNLIDLVRLRHYSLSINESYLGTDIKSIVERIITERANCYNYTGGIDKHFDCPDLIEMQEEDLEIIVYEIIDNMFKFSSSNNVKIGLHKKEAGNKRSMIFTVSNSIFAPMIFSTKDIAPFKQYNKVKNEKQGCGLGLYLIQLIIEKYLGTIDIEITNEQLFQIILTVPLI